MHFRVTLPTAASPSLLGEPANYQPQEVSGAGILPAAVALLRVRGQPEVTSRTEPLMRYEIRVEGILDARWSEWFDGLRVSSDASGTTTIAGPVRDQAALHGLLIKVRDLGLPLIAVCRIGPD